MSLEAKIELLTAAVVELTRVMQSKPAVQVTGPVVTDFTKSCLATAAPGLSFNAEEVPNENQGQAKSSPTTDTSPPSLNESPAVTYKEVADVTVAVSKLDRKKAVAGLARFGAKNAKELQEKQWSDYVVYMKRVAAGEIDPESSHA